MKVAVKDVLAQSLEMIRSHYGNGRASRSGLPLMNHIDEGLAIMARLGAEETAMAAFAVHPIFQDDGDLVENWDQLSRLQWEVLALTLEYRNFANAYLSSHWKGPDDRPHTPSHGQVRLMLVADKVQNHKDFMIHHFGKHEKGDFLLSYFHNWFRVLGIGSHEYFALVEELDHVVYSCPQPGNVNKDNQSSGVDP